MSLELEQFIKYSDYQDTTIPEHFNKYHKNQVQNIINWKVVDQAISRKEVYGISIDGIDSKDLDDAIRIEKTKKWYCLFVHIADVTEFIHTYSPLDLEALKRTTSIYLPDRVIPMIPSELSNGLFSLDTNGDVTKNTLTFQIDLDEEWNEITTNFYESKFTNLHRHDYESFRSEFWNPDYEHFDTIHLMDELSQKLRSKRLKQWANLDYSDTVDGIISISDKDSANFNLPGIMSGHDMERLPHIVVEECMVQANVSIWNILAQNQDFIWIFRGHDAANEKAYYHHDKHILHFALALRNYLHVTSPIRRYPDMAVHRELKNLLQEQVRTIKKWPALTRKTTSFIWARCNNIALKNDLIGWALEYQHKWTELLEKFSENWNNSPETYDFKNYIRNGCNQKHKLAKPVRRAIIKKIQNWNLGDWAWLAGVVLLWVDQEIKNAVRQKVLYEQGSLSLTSFIHTLEHTQILRWGGVLFTFDEQKDKNNYSISCNYAWNKIASWKSRIEDWETYSYTQARGKRELIKKIFDYFSEK